MSDQRQVEPQVPGEPHASFEERSRPLFRDSVDGLDFALRSRLTQARTAAMEAASKSRRPWFSLFGAWTPAAGVTAAAVLGAILCLGAPLGQHAAAVTDGLPNFDDLEMVASSDEGSADAMDMLQDDIEFYDWAERAANSG